MQNLISSLSDWVDTTVSHYLPQAQNCAQLAHQFNGFFPVHFLKNSHFVVTETIPKPTITVDAPLLKEFIEMGVKPDLS